MAEDRVERPQVAWIDIIDACHLRCPTCIRGVRGIENSGRKMPLEMFEQIIAKVKAERYTRRPAQLD